ncbi:MAG: hypothetical protein GWN00_07390, partial [Aliifodinibius sp.]|nr:M1 family metallopeptidase [Fodinibius sp.]NIV11052.1 hypothetical protein [Fodinibius sp.]NIY24639.1 hypothetical protein [Fodinibius sp.]
FDQKASSEDFIAYAEQSTGQNLDWFFDQWIYEVDVPLYKYAINVTPTEYNYHRVSLRVKQENVEDNFRMPVIIGLDFGNDIIIKKRVWVEGPVSEFNLGEYIFKPQKVIFNHLESVLCEVKQVDWE